MNLTKYINNNQVEPDTMDMAEAVFCLSHTGDQIIKSVIPPFAHTKSLQSLFTDNCSLFTVH